MRSSTRSTRHPRLGPGQRLAEAGVRPTAERQLLTRVGPIDDDVGGSVEATRVAVGGTVEQRHGRARRDGHAAEVRGLAGQAEMHLHRSLDPQHLLEEVRDQLAVGPQRRLILGMLGEMPHREHDQAHRGLLTGDEDERRLAGEIGRRRQRAVRERAFGQLREHVVARVRSTILDVADEVLLQERQRVALDRRALAVAAPLLIEPRPEPGQVLLGDTEEIGDDQRR